MLERVPQEKFTYDRILARQFVTASKRDLDDIEPERELSEGTYFQRDHWKVGVRGRDLSKNSFCPM